MGFTREALNAVIFRETMGRKTFNQIEGLGIGKSLSMLLEQHKFVNADTV